MSKTNKKDVGKGIRALLANIDKKESRTANNTAAPEEIPEVSSGTGEIDIKSIEANPYQPRKEFNEDQLNELMTSIKTHGLIQPITVRRLNAKKYQIISGERRWRASKLAGLIKVPVFIREADDQGMLEMALLENIQRADLNPVEIAISYQRLIDECDLTHEELSERLGKSRSAISNNLRVLKLAPSVQKALKERSLSLGHAKILAGIVEIERQTMALGEILSKGLSVRATEILVKNLTSRKTKPVAPAKTEHPGIAGIIEDLSDTFGTNVRINRSDKGKGQIKISFSSDREFNDIIDRILDK
ncbi:MAG: ParB family chromosome partitioning protein [Saprospiraceae bacterium]|jgi:ParB family chromosome partitioning protein